MHHLRTVNTWGIPYSLVIYHFHLSYTISIVINISKTCDTFVKVDLEHSIWTYFPFGNIGWSSASTEPSLGMPPSRPHFGCFSIKWDADWRTNTFDDTSKFGTPFLVGLEGLFWCWCRRFGRPMMSSALRKYGTQKLEGMADSRWKMWRVPPWWCQIWGAWFSAGWRKPTN